MMHNTSRSVAGDIVAHKRPTKPTLKEPPVTEPTKHRQIGLKHFIAHFVGSTIARSSVLLGGALGAFIGTIALYLLSVNRGVVLDGYTILLTAAAGIILGIVIDVAINLILFIRK